MNRLKLIYYEMFHFEDDNQIFQIYIHKVDYGIQFDFGHRLFFGFFLPLPSLLNFRTWTFLFAISFMINDFPTCSQLTKWRLLCYFKPTSNTRSSVFWIIVLFAYLFFWQYTLNIFISFLVQRNIPSTKSPQCL